MSNDALRFPIGKYEIPAVIDEAQLVRWIDEIAALPADMRQLALSLSETQLDTPYRPEGWTARQVIHHVPDSHINAFQRFKLALTEEAPAVKPYLEAEWANLPDVALTPIAVSLDFLDLLHQRWVILMRAMSPQDWKRTYVHPGYGRTYRLDAVAGLYAWHGRHHLGHLKLVAEQ